MLSVFIACFVIGLGALAVQLLGGHDGGGGHDAGGHDASGHDGPLLFLASIRFWAFALLVFGLVGSLLRIFGFAGRIESSIIATVAGVAVGYVAVAMVKRLQGDGTSSVATSRDVVGRVGRVIVAPSNETRGKVRVSVRGADVDYVARSAEPLEPDDAIIVEEYEGDEVLVSRAPKELEEPRKGS
jgi:membrane protein implicated in regulation of membrane protease activity